MRGGRHDLSISAPQRQRTRAVPGHACGRRNSGSRLPNYYSIKAVAEALDGLLRSPAVRARCGESAQRLRRLDAVAETCRLIEDLGRPGPSRAA